MVVNVIVLGQSRVQTVNNKIRWTNLSINIRKLLALGALYFLAPRQRMVTVANYFKHYHLRLRYFAFNTQMRHRALQTGRIYIHQNPHDGHLSVDELREMVGHDSDALSNLVLHFGASIHGTRQFWQKQKNHLTAMADTPAWLVCSSHLVLLTCSGQNLLIYSMLKKLEMVLPAGLEL